MTEQPEEPVTLPTSDCTICSHPAAAAIDEALLAGTAIRTVARTHGVSHSAVGRHKLNHLSVQAITEQEPTDRSGPLRLVDVHGQLASLVDRLESVVELAARTRKAPAAVAAMRELRQTLVAIAELQATPELQKAATLQELQGHVTKVGVGALVRMFDFVLQQFGFESTTRLIGSPQSERERILAGLMVDCLRELNANGAETGFAKVDTSKATAYVERLALERAQRIEAEVRRRVDAELRRRENQARPAIEARPTLALEGEVPLWTV